jgi:hypothetical protein
MEDHDSWDRSERGLLVWSWQWVDCGGGFDTFKIFICSNFL